MKWRSSGTRERAYREAAWRTASTSAAGAKSPLQQQFLSELNATLIGTDRTAETNLTIDLDGQTVMRVIVRPEGVQVEISHEFVRVGKSCYLGAHDAENPTKVIARAVQEVVGQLGQYWKYDG